MTLTQTLARAAIKWLSRLAEDPPEAEEDTLANASRAELVAVALERQTRQGALRGLHHPPPLPLPPTAEEEDSHLRYSPPKTQHSEKWSEARKAAEPEKYAAMVARASHARQARKARKS